MKMHRIIFFLAGISAILITSCSKQGDISQDTDRICLSASVGQMAAKAGEVAIVSGTYHLAYTPSPEGRAVCMVSFADSRGYPLVRDGNGVYSFLKWDDIARVADKDYYLFMLDNLENGTDAGTVLLGEEYQAASLDASPQLDIIWGTTKVSGTSAGKDINMTLSHRMSKLYLELGVKTEGIILEGKTVKITLSNIMDVPVSFDRNSGLVSVSGSLRTDVVLYEGVLLQDGKNFVIPSPWIFPPQTFDPDSWPVLSVEFDGQVFEGPLNPYMIQEDGDTETPIALKGLDPGRFLTLRANLSLRDDKVELIFMPVLIRKWDEIDNIGIIARQRGIYSESDYIQLVGAYNASEKNEQVLNKFGTYDNIAGIWEFTLYRNVGDASGAAGMPKFADGNFNIRFNSYSIYGYTSKDDLYIKDGTSGEGGEL